MRLNPIYFGSRRQPQQENKVRFKEVLPLKLKNQVSGMGKSSLENKCLFEMSLLFACWKKTDFDNNKCNDLIRNLEICYKNLTTVLKEEKENRKKEIPIPGSKNLTDKQLSYLLRKYPTV